VVLLASSLQQYFPPNFFRQTVTPLLPPVYKNYMGSVSLISVVSSLKNFTSSAQFLLPFSDAFFPFDSKTLRKSAGSKRRARCLLPSAGK
jgi:hypothetical protein